MFCFSQVRLRPQNGWRGRQMSTGSAGIKAMWWACRHLAPSCTSLGTSRWDPPKMTGKDTNRNPKKVKPCKHLALIVNKLLFDLFFWGDYHDPTWAANGRWKGDAAGWSNQLGASVAMGDANRVLDGWNPHGSGRTSQRPKEQRFGSWDFGHVY